MTKIYCTENEDFNSLNAKLAAGDTIVFESLRSFPAKSLTQFFWLYSDLLLEKGVSIEFKDRPELSASPDNLMPLKIMEACLKIDGKNADRETRRMSVDIENPLFQKYYWLWQEGKTDASSASEMAGILRVSLYKAGARYEKIDAYRVVLHRKLKTIITCPKRGNIPANFEETLLKNTENKRTRIQDIADALDIEPVDVIRIILRKPSWMEISGISHEMLEQKLLLVCTCCGTKLALNYDEPSFKCPSCEGATYLKAVPT